MQKSREIVTSWDRFTGKKLGFCVNSGIFVTNLAGNGCENAVIRLWMWDVWHEASFFMEALT